MRGARSRPPGLGIKSVDCLARVGVALSAFLVVPNVAQAAPAATCQQSDVADVVSRERDGEVGDDIYVRVRSAGPAREACVYKPMAGDWLVGKGEAFYVKALKGRFLAIDAGTGAKRRLLIFDVSTRAKRADADYDDQKSLQVDADAIRFWQIAAKPVKPAACPAAWRKANAGARQAHKTTEIRFTVSDATSSLTGATDCMLTEDDT